MEFQLAATCLKSMPDDFGGLLGTGCDFVNVQGQFAVTAKNEAHMWMVGGVSRKVSHWCCSNRFMVSGFHMLIEAFTSIQFDFPFFLLAQGVKICQDLYLCL